MSESLLSLCWCQPHVTLLQLRVSGGKHKWKENCAPNPMVLQSLCNPPDFTKPAKEHLKELSHLFRAHLVVFAWFADRLSPLPRSVPTDLSLLTGKLLDMYIPWGLFPFLSPLRRWCGGRYLSATVNFHFTVLWVVWLWSSHWFHLCRLRRRMVFGLQTHLWDEIATLTTKSVSQ